MKKLIITTFALLAITAMAFTQMRIHPIAGVNLSNFNEDYEDVEFNSQAGFEVGVGLRFGDQVYIEPAVMYFQVNNQVEIFQTDAVDVIVDERETKVKGLKVPVMVGVDLIASEENALRLFGGPNMVYIMDSNEQIFADEEVEFERAGWGLNAGAGVDIGSITIDVFREWGMHDAFNDDQQDTSNNYWHLVIGLLL